MSYRCVEPFATANGDVYGGGLLVSDDDPILQSHGGHFARVSAVTMLSTATETATAAPGEHRSAPPRKAPAKKVTAPEPKIEPEGDNE